MHSHVNVKEVYTALLGGTEIYHCQGLLILPTSNRFHN